MLLNLLKKRKTFCSRLYVYLTTFRYFQASRRLRCSPFLSTVRAHRTPNGDAAVYREIGLPHGVLSEPFEHVILGNVFVLVAKRGIARSIRLFLGIRGTRVRSLRRSVTESSSKKRNSFIIDCNRYICNVLDYPDSSQISTKKFGRSFLMFLICYKFIVAIS